MSFYVWYIPKYILPPFTPLRRAILESLSHFVADAWASIVFGLCNNCRLYGRIEAWLLQFFLIITWNWCEIQCSCWHGCLHNVNTGFSRGNGSHVINKPKTCFFYMQLDNGKRHSVDTDMVVCTISIPISLNRSKNSKNIF